MLLLLLLLTIPHNQSIIPHNPLLSLVQYFNCVWVGKYYYYTSKYYYSALPRLLF